MKKSRNGNGLLLLGLLLGVLWLCPGWALAAADNTVTVEGVVYTLDEENGTAEVTGWAAESFPVSGSVAVLGEVEQDGVKYGVTGVKERAFMECGLIKRLSFAEGMQVIGERAFCLCQNLESVTLPDSLERIDSNAFRVCPALVELEWGNGPLDIGEGAFAYCRALPRLTIPANIQSLDMDVFNGCESLEEVDIAENLKELPNSTFANCKRLKTIKLPDSLEVIQNQAFGNCEALEHVDFGSGLMTLDGSVFGGCTSLTEFSVPEGITRLGSGLFEKCTALQTVHLPDSLETIGGLVFQDCTALETITLPKNVSQLDKSAFGGCVHLQSIEVAPDNAWFLSLDGLLYDKKPLAIYLCPPGKEGVLTIADGLSVIYEESFYRCDKITAVNLPASMDMVYPGAFAGCTGIEAFSVAEGNAYLCAPDGVLYRDKTKLLAYPAAKNGPYVVPEGVTAIAQQAMEGCSGVTALQLPSTLETIGNNAFVGLGIREITFPDSLDTTGVGTFQSCKNLTKVTLGNGIKKIDNDAFGWCDDLEEIVWNDVVESIGYDPFGFCLALKKIELPASVRQINVGAFAFSSGLQSIEVAADNPNYSSIDGVLFDKQQEVLLRYPRSKAAKRYTVPKTVRKIGENAFYNCRFIQNVALRPGVEEIASSAFEGCEKLEEVWLPEGLTAIGNSAFINGGHLQALTLPATLRTIGRSGFYLNEVESLVVPAGVTSIGEEAFANSLRLRQVALLCDADVCKWDGGTRFAGFARCKQLAEALVRTGQETAWAKKLPKGVHITATDYFVIFADPEQNQVSAAGIATDTRKVAKPANPSRSGYTFGGWYQDEGLSQAWDFANDQVTRDTTLYAKWVKNNSTGGGGSGGGGGASVADSYEIHVIVGTGGVVSPNSVSVEKNGRQTFRITADSGYEIASVLVDGKSVGKVDRYTFDKVTAKHTLEVKFVKLATGKTEQPQGTDATFADVPQGSWFAAPVGFVQQRGFMQGVTADKFDPQGVTSRAMAATVLYRLAGSPEASGEAGFADVAANAYYAKAVAWAANNGIVKGLDETTFAPGNPVTREQLAVLFYGYAKQEKLAEKSGKAPDGFVDSGEVSVWAREAVAYCVGAGVLNGDGAGRLSPQGQATRAEFAAMLQRFDGLLAAK